MKRGPCTQGQASPVQPGTPLLLPHKKNGREHSAPAAVIYFRAGDLPVFNLLNE
jgi:hypothetical protein